MAIKKKQGFTIFFATLIGSLALALGVAVFDITMRELDLSQSATASLYAIYAADAGAECALYWDLKCTSSTNAYCGFSGGSAFATSADAWAGGVDSNATLNCNAMNIRNSAAPALWTVTAISSPVKAATTTFDLRFDQANQQGKPYCARVSVGKTGNPSRTMIISRGFNTCASYAPLRLERTLQLVY